MKWLQNWGGKKSAYLLLGHHLTINLIGIKVLFYYVIIVVELVKEKVRKTIMICLDVEVSRKVVYFRLVKV